MSLEIKQTSLSILTSISRISPLRWHAPSTIRFFFFFFFFFKLRVDGAHQLKKNARVTDARIQISISLERFGCLAKSMEFR
jgi:hypothetical protein